MKIRVKKQQLLFGLVAFLGIVLVATELFILSPDVRVGYAGLLEWLGRWDSLTGMLDDDSHEVRAAASEGSIRHGGAAVPALSRGADRLDARGRCLAVFTLGRIGREAGDAVPTLERRAREDPDDQVRGNAIRALALIGEDDPPVVETLAGLLATGGEADRATVAETLGHMGPKAAETVGALARALKDPSPRVRLEAAEALGAVGPAARGAVPGLADALRDPHLAVCVESAEALGALGAASKEAVPSLLAALDHPHPKVRSTAAEALELIASKLGPEGDSVRRQVAAALKREKSREAGPSSGKEP